MTASYFFQGGGRGALFGIRWSFAELSVIDDRVSGPTAYATTKRTGLEYHKVLFLLHNDICVVNVLLSTVSPHRQQPTMMLMLLPFACLVVRVAMVMMCIRLFGHYDYGMHLILVASVQSKLPIRSNPFQRAPFQGKWGAFGGITVRGGQTELTLRSGAGRSSHWPGS